MKTKIWTCFICGDPIDFTEIKNPVDQLEVMIQHYCEDCGADTVDTSNKPRMTAADLIMLREMKISL